MGQELPKILYHYTSWKTFKDIVTNHTWRFSSINGTNDLSEDLNSYVKQLLNDRKLIHNINQNAKNKIIRNIEANNYFGSKKFFIACFSTENDDLGQWRVKYGDYGRGVCIGINPRFFTEHLYKQDCDTLGWAKITYEIAEQKKLLTNITKKLEAPDEYWGMDNCDILSQEIRDIALIMKHKAFKIENEWRMIVSMEGETILDDNFCSLEEDFKKNENERLYFKKNTNKNIQEKFIVHCLDYDLNSYERTGTGDLFISILLGKDSKHKEKEVKNLLENYGFNVQNIKISKSNIPYNFTRGQKSKRGKMNIECTTIEKNIIDKDYCMSHYLAFRYVPYENINFFKGLSHKLYKSEQTSKIPVENVEDIERIIKEQINKHYIKDKTAILLSGGMDSAIIASYLPAGTPAYTFKCVAPGAVDETERACAYARKYNLDHHIIEMYWEDFEKLTPEILKDRGVPFHSIEVQLLKAARAAKSQGIEYFITGECADRIFGGLDKILSKEWDYDEFKNFYNFTDPYKVLKEPVNIDDIYEKYRLDHNKIDYMRFMKEIYCTENAAAYVHAFSMAKVTEISPYSVMELAKPLDLTRIRNGESKYLIRELFKKRYPDIPIPEKIPMPRATDQWLKDYKVSKPEFIENCTESLTGDQKWQLYCLETFLNMYEEVKI